MMKVRSYCLLSVLSLGAALVLYAYQHNWIIIWYPQAPGVAQELSDKQSLTKKTINLWYWHQEHWSSEEAELMWPSDTAQTLAVITNRWLALAEEEALTPQRVLVQATALTPEGTQAFISFDRSPFDAESSTYAKWMIIEGILKTIRESGLALQGIYFLVHHQPLADYHLDFSNPWPIIGFLS